MNSDYCPKLLDKVTIVAWSLSGAVDDIDALSEGWITHVNDEFVMVQTCEHGLLKFDREYVKDYGDEGLYKNKGMRITVS